MEQTTPTEVEAYTPEAREEVRTEIADAVAEFLRSGGKVDEIAKGERADPPKAPENNYGRGSI